MTAPESTEPIDTAAIMAEHSRHEFDAGAVGVEVLCAACAWPTPWPCMPYRLAAALDVERVRVQRVEAALKATKDEPGRESEPGDWKRGARHVRVAVDRALAGDTEGDQP